MVCIILCSSHPQTDLLAGLRLHGAAVVLRFCGKQRVLVHLIFYILSHNGFLTFLCCLLSKTFVAIITILSELL